MPKPVQEHSQPARTQDNDDWRGHMRSDEANQKENLEKGWTIKYITEFATPVNFYLRGEEYSAQIDYFVKNIMNKKQGSHNTFEQGQYTDKVIEMILGNAKQN